METTTFIKDSFEMWYNTTISKDSPVSIVINYSDTQKLNIKAFHTSTIEMQAIKLSNGKSEVIPIIKLEENYNHGITTEEEAKYNMATKLMAEVYNYVRLM